MRKIKFVYGTHNAGKLASMRRMLEGLPIEVVGLCDIDQSLPAVQEEGETPLENAEIKARAYQKALGLPVFSCDSGLYIDGLPENEQPGVCVRRVADKELTDEEMITHYAGLARDHGGQLQVQYVNAIALALDHGEMISHQGRDISSIPFLFVDTPHHRRVEGFPLDSISAHIESGAYYYDLEAAENTNAHEEMSIKEGIQRFFKRALEGRVSPCEK